MPSALCARVRLLNLSRNTGPAIRWVWLDRSCEDSTIALVLDDDFTLEPTYVERTLAPIEQGSADVVGWFGLDTRWRHYKATHDVPTPRCLRVVAGGACALRGSALRGLDHYPLARHLSGLDGGDDVWSSAVMRRNGARMMRPAGRAPIRNTEHQNDIRSIRFSRGLDAGKLFLASELLAR